MFTRPVLIQLMLRQVVQLALLDQAVLLVDPLLQRRELALLQQLLKFVRLVLLYFHELVVGHVQVNLYQYSVE